MKNHYSREILRELARSGIEVIRSLPEATRNEVENFFIRPVGESVSIRKKKKKRGATLEISSNYRAPSVGNTCVNSYDFPQEFHSRWFNKKKKNEREREREKRKKKTEKELGFGLTYSRAPS